MAIEFPSSSIGPAAGRPTRERAAGQARRPAAPAARAAVNHIPEPESLATLIRSAVEALRQGIFWDRGTILNLLA